MVRTERQECPVSSMSVEQDTSRPSLTETSVIGTKSPMLWADFVTSQLDRRDRAAPTASPDHEFFARQSCQTRESWAFCNSANRIAPFANRNAWDEASSVVEINRPAEAARSSYTKATGRHQSDDTGRVLHPLGKVALKVPAPAVPDGRPGVDRAASAAAAHFRRSPHR